MSADELRRLYQSESSPQFAKKEEQMLTEVIEKTRAFDRRIAVRNAVECGAGLLVTILFSWFAWRAPGLLERAGHIIVAAGGLWIASYVHYFGRGPRALDRGLGLNSYQQLLQESYDRQIRLLRNVKYWYLAPLYVGLVVFNAGLWLRLKESGVPAWAPAINLLVLTLVFALIWVLNEVIGVRHLQGLKRALLDLTEGKKS